MRLRIVTLMRNAQLKLLEIAKPDKTDILTISGESGLSNIFHKVVNS
jgi:hypothetical protein